MKIKNTVLASLLLILTATIQSNAADQKITELDHIASAAFANHTAGGVVLVRDSEDVIYRKAFGMADIEHDVKMRPDSVMKIASVTKQFTAVAILQLIEAGKLKFNDTLADIIAGYPDPGAKVTVRQLLNQTSGIKNISRIEASRQARPLDATADELIAYFSELPLEFPSGTRWQYSNSNYILLTRIIEIVSEMAYSDYMNTHIFEPLNMKDTRYGSRFPIIKHRAHGYRMNDGLLENANYISMTQPQGAGALISTIDDLDLWDRGLYSEKLISKELISLAATPVKFADGSTFMYGFGWILPQIRGVNSMEHNGAIDGFFSHVVRVPDHNVYVAVLANAENIPSQELAEELAAIAIDRPINRIKSTQSKLEQFVGEYDFGNGQLRMITANDDVLYEQINGGPKNRLSETKSGQFFYDIGLNYVTFDQENGRGEMVLHHRFAGQMKGTKKSEAH